MIFFDTAPLIYLLDRDDSRVHSQIERWTRSGEEFASSCVTLAELLVHPKRFKDRQRESRYRLYLSRLMDIPLIVVDERVAEQAAGIRAEYGFETPDAFQLAAAMVAGADVFYTNDKQLKQFSDLNVLLVGE